MNNAQKTTKTTNTQLAEIVNFFNKETMFEPVTELNEYDMRNLKISINQHGVDVIKKAFAKANNSRFLTGNKGYEWKANFGWLIVPEHITKILNGDYDDYKRKPKAPAHSEFFESSIDDEDELINVSLARGFDDLI